MMLNKSWMLESCRNLLSEADIDSIIHEWRMLKPPFVIKNRQPPQPVWCRRGFTANGPQAWDEVRKKINEGDQQRAFCIYIHLPFCASKCGFCDCYSYRISKHRQRHVSAYLDRLEKEIQLWGQIENLTRKTVSTVHLGGGTPTFLTEPEFTRLIHNVRQYLVKDTPIEWALETTSSELTGGIPDMLDGLGFRRIHVGVQSLDDEVRARIHRREKSSVVLEKIARGVERGWVVSVDLILGLPGQSVSSVLEDIRLLAGAGVDGFSLYVLQVSSRNQRFIEKAGGINEDLFDSYLMFQAASRLLFQSGYRKTLFNHFARAKDTNLYFNFPERGEDCLALGTIADGVFGDYHYRHLEYNDYLQQATPTFPGLQGGTCRSAEENKIFPLEVALLSSRLSYQLFQEVCGTEICYKLFETWKGHSLIHADRENSNLFHLSANGSWFVGTMMRQLQISMNKNTASP